MLATLADKLRFIELVFGRGKLARNSKNIDVRCPICAPRDKAKRKLAIRVEDDAVHCWTCGFKARSLAPLIKKHGTAAQLAEYRDKHMTAAQRAWSANQQSEKAPEPLKLPADFKLLAAAQPGDPDVLALRSYLFVKRGVTERDLWRFRLGYSEEQRWRRRVIVPSFDSAGVLNYFVARAIDQNRYPKYDNPDHDKLPIVFNELNVDWSERLIVCEGPLDLVKCPDNSVPLLGSDLNEESRLFCEIVAHSTPVDLALDGDMWETKALRVAKKLSEYDIDVRLVDVRPFGDPGAATREQVKRAIDEARAFSWSGAFSTRLHRAAKTTLFA